MQLLIYLLKHTLFISYTNNHLVFEPLSNFYFIINLAYIITDSILFTLFTVYELLISDYKNMSH